MTSFHRPQGREEIEARLEEIDDLTVDLQLQLEALQSEAEDLEYDRDQLILIAADNNEGY